MDGNIGFMATDWCEQQKKAEPALCGNKTKVKTGCTLRLRILMMSLPAHSQPQPTTLIYFLCIETKMEWQKLELSRASLIKKEVDAAISQLNDPTSVNPDLPNNKTNLVYSIQSRIQELENFYIRNNDGIVCSLNFCARLILLIFR